MIRGMRLGLYVAAVFLALGTTNVWAGSWPVDCADTKLGLSISFNHYSKKSATDYASVPTYIGMSAQKKLVKLTRKKRLGGLLHLSFEGYSVIYSGISDSELPKHVAVYNGKGEFLSAFACK